MPVLTVPESPCPEKGLITSQLLSLVSLSNQYNISRFLSISPLGELNFYKGRCDGEYCQLDRIRYHLGDKPLGVFVRKCLD